MIEDRRQLTVQCRYPKVDTCQIVLSASALYQNTNAQNSLALNRGRSDFIVPGVARRDYGRKTSQHRSIGQTDYGGNHAGLPTNRLRVDAYGDDLKLCSG